MISPRRWRTVRGRSSFGTPRVRYALCIVNVVRARCPAASHRKRMLARVRARCFGQMVSVVITFIE